MADWYKVKAKVPPVSVPGHSILFFPLFPPYNREALSLGKKTMTQQLSPAQIRPIRLSLN